VYGLGAGGFLSLAVALDNCSHSLVGIMTSVIILSLSLDDLPPPPDSNVDLFLEGSLVPCHLSLLAACKIAGVWLGGGQEGALKELHLLKQAAPATS
jgi:hypothetical protein